MRRVLILVLALIDAPIVAQSTFELAAEPLLLRWGEVRLSVAWTYLDTWSFRLEGQGQNTDSLGTLRAGRLAGRWMSDRLMLPADPVPAQLFVDLSTGYGAYSFLRESEAVVAQYQGFLFAAGGGMRHRVGFFFFDLVVEYVAEPSRQWSFLSTDGSSIGAWSYSGPLPQAATRTRVIVGVQF